GTLTVSVDEQDAIRVLAAEPDIVAAHTATYEDRGLLPTAWRTRDSWLGTFFASTYVSIGALRANHSCLIVIFATGCLLVVLAALALAWFEFAVNKAALRTVNALREQIHDQAHRLGAGDLFLGHQDTARELFTTLAD